MREWSYVRPLAELQELYLSRTKVGDAGIESLRGLTELRILDLWATRVGSDGLQHLQPLGELRELDSLEDPRRR